jgi:hypothetical protein
MTPDRPVSIIPSPRVCAHEPIIRQGITAAARLLTVESRPQDFIDADWSAFLRAYLLVTQQEPWVVLPCVASQVVEKDATISGLSERVAGQLGEIRRLESLLSLNRKPLSAVDDRSGDASEVRPEDQSHAPGWIKTGEAVGPDGIVQETGHVAGVTTHALGKRFGDFAEDRRAPIDDDSPLRRHARPIPTPEQLAASERERGECAQPVLRCGECDGTMFYKRTTEGYRTLHSCTPRRVRQGFDFLRAELAAARKQHADDAVTLEYRSAVIETQNERAKRDADEIERLRAERATAQQAIDEIMRAFGRNATNVTDPLEVASIVARELTHLRLWQEQQEQRSREAAAGIVEDADGLAPAAICQRLRVKVETMEADRRPGPCGHAWDHFLHRACPRCAISAVESVLGGIYERLEKIYSESCIVGYDSGNTAVAALAQEALDLWRSPRESLADDDAALKEGK